MIVHPIPYQEPQDVYLKFMHSPWSLWLDSAAHSEQGRYSFITVDPFSTFVCKRNKIVCDQQILYGNPFELLKQKIIHYQLDPIFPAIPFPGGVAGFFGYELNQHIETIPSKQVDDMQVPDLMVGFFDVVIGFDHHEKLAWICSTGLPQREKKANQLRAKRRLEAVLEPLHKPLSKEIRNSTHAFKALHAVTSNFSPEHYMSAVEKVKNYIYLGDIFEANIAQRFSGILHGAEDTFPLYQQLRRRNPAPFAAYLKFGKTCIASASPERFIQLKRNRQVEACPIKGTRPRGGTLVEDKQLAEELAASEKDRAENIMIVDLIRNDLSKVCENHSVKVEKLCNLVTYSNVHHLVSQIVGQLNKNKTAIDLLEACFPGGSVTGAPKPRAMEIIAEIEPHVRGPYCGSMGYIGSDGTMDLSIVIRTFVMQGKKISFHAGGAVTTGSHAELEYRETLDKVMVLQKILTNR